MSTLDKRNPIAKAVKLALLAGVAVSTLSTPAAFAAEEDEAKDEKITITGSRIKRTEIESSSPVQVTSSEEIALSGFTKVEDLMNSLPQVEAAETSFQANGASGTATIDLRGMGANRTLVLINGRRLPSGGVFSQNPDVNQIPASLVERVEVLTGGGSSTYGADAVAGVVNFVMNTEFEGLEVNYGVSGFQHDNDNTYMQNLMDQRGFSYPKGDSGFGGATRNLDITMGGSFDGGKGHATAYATVREVKELRQGSRDYSSCALNNAGTACGGSFNAIIPNTWFAAVDENGVAQYQGFGVADLYTLDPTSDPNNTKFIHPGLASNVYNYAPVNHFMRPDKRYTFGAFINYEINDYVRPYMELGYMRDRTAAQIAESGTFFNTEYRFPITSSMFSEAQRAQLIADLGVDPVNGIVAAYIGKRNVEGGPRASLLEHNSIRMVVGSEGDISDNWSYDASLQYGSTSSSQNYINDFFGPRITTAVNPELCAQTAGCIVYDVFRLNGVTEAAAASLAGVGILNGLTEQLTFNAFVSGDFDVALPSAESTIAGVLGIESRRVSFDRQSDEVFEQGLLLGQGGPTASLGGSFSIDEIFGELSLPVVEGVTGFERLALDLGFRYSDYSTSGGESTYKLGVDWAITDDWKVRASYNRSVRAPNVAELFASQSLGLWTGSDPCAGATPTLSAAECANTGVTAAQYGNISISPAGQYNGFFGGNPNLTPEIADTLTFGVVANPIENLNFSIDYFDIEVEDVIGSITPQLTVTQCGKTGLAAFCDNVTRNSNGSLWVGQQGFVKATTINLASRHWEGIDFSVNHEFEALGGTFTTKMIGTLMEAKEYDPLPGVPNQKYDCVDEINSINNCFATPKWRHTLSVTYTPDSFWSVQAKWRYFGEVGYAAEARDQILVAHGGISAQQYYDVVGTFELTEQVNVLFGINNITDKEPPLVGNTVSTNANTVAGFYDTLGRYIHANVTLRF